MKDITGNEIAVGCNVVFGRGQSMNLLQGVVKKINPKTVTIGIEYESTDYYTKEKSIRVLEYKRTFDNVVVV